MKRIFSATLACALALTLLTSCGSKDAGSSSSVPVTPAGSSQSSAASSAPDTSVPDISAPEAPGPSPDSSVPADVPLPHGPGIGLNKWDFTLNTPGSSYRLKFSADGFDKAKAVWSSSDESIASVDQKGTVTAVSPGTATITVALDGMEVSCIVRCSWKEESETPDPSDSPSDSASAVDLREFFFALAAQYGENFAADADIVEYGLYEDLYPGISKIGANQLVMYQPMMGAVVCEIALIEVVDSANVEAVKAIFQARIDAQVDGGAWYPASIEGWQNHSRIVSNGNYVMMIAWELCDEAVTAFNALF